jgi:GT2 family glycosyltransferase
MRFARFRQTTISRIMRTIRSVPTTKRMNTTKRGSVLLRLQVHWDAARHAPHAYMTALWWRLRRKRVRARAQFAPLLGSSPRAYRLWLSTEIRTLHVCQANIPILALIDARGRTETDGCDKTLHSLAAEGITALVIGSAEITNLATAARSIDWHEDPWLLPVGVGDIIAPGTADIYRQAITEAAASCRIIYADDDLIDAAGLRSAPHFKPDWNAELFRHFDYLTGACLVRASARDLVDLPATEWAARLIDPIARAAQEEATPFHVREILHHRVTRPTPRAIATPATSDPSTLPSTSVIIPTRNQLALLRTCLAGLETTDYPDIEVIIVDNDSDDPATLAYLAALDRSRYRVIRHRGPFNFSVLNNRAAREAKGRLLCLLNNDIEVLAPDWLARMADQALRPDVGAVGARLLYPDGRIQHAGVVLGVGGGAAHAHRLLRPEEEGYFRRHSLPQFVSAVTAACLVVQAERFAAVGGLDETNFAVAFNDVDLCMRLNARGWQSLYEPRATLIHHESVSRGLDRDAIGAARLAGELAALKAAWGTGDCVDRFHHPELSPFSERFVVRL